MEFTEANLELLAKKLYTCIDSRVSKLAPSDIISLSEKIPNVENRAQFKEDREKFLARFNDPCPLPEVITYSKTALDAPTKINDEKTDIIETMSAFFSSEITRISKIRDIILKRCINSTEEIQSHPSFIKIIHSINKYTHTCEKGLAGLQNEEPMFSPKDILIELSSSFFSRNRKALYRSLIRNLRQFILTNRKSIFSDVFKLMRDYYVEDQSHDIVPLMLSTEEEIDLELVRLAKCFKLSTDINASDGQGFLYNSEKTFHRIFPFLVLDQYTVKDVEIDDVLTFKESKALTQYFLSETTTADVNFGTILKTLFIGSKEEILQFLNNSINEYNANAGNEIRGKKLKPLIPKHKITSFLKLRFIRTKYLAFCLFMMENYYCYVKNLIQNRNHKYKVRANSFAPEIIEITEDGNPIIFKDTIKHFTKLQSNIIKAASVFTSKFEMLQVDSNSPDNKIIDRYAIMEKIFSLELRFANAKRSLIQSLLEVDHHLSDNSISLEIHKVINEEPILNLNLYKSFEVPYEIAISLMEKKSKIIRFLVNAQILHERTIAEQAGEDIPLIDRPYLLSEPELLHKLFTESVPTTPFEVYQNLKTVTKFIHVIPSIASEMAEDIGIRYIKYAEYVELAVWSEFEIMFHNMAASGFFPFDRSAINFNYPLSPCVKSLFDSPYVNSLESVTKLIANVNENRRLRFLMTMRRFFFLTWKLQDSIITSDTLMKSYYDQCKELEIEERSVLLTPFTTAISMDVVELHKESCLDMIDFALSEFENAEMNFSNQNTIKDIIYAADFNMLMKLITFQKLQNTELELAVRYNTYIIDNNFVVHYFNLNGTDSMFMTGAETAETANERLIRKHLAETIFYYPKTLMDTYKEAAKDRQQYSLVISHIKSKSRTILSAHAKQKTIDPQQMIELYRNEMVDAFAPSAYRIEISRICDLERQLLLTNTFVDTHTLGPDAAGQLIDDDGHFEKFFYVPTWTEVFRMLRDSPHARQGMVLRSLLQFLTARIRIFCIVRAECALTQRLSTVFGSLYSQQFLCETPAFRKILQALEHLPDSREVEISAKYMQDFEHFLFLRFEYGLLEFFENFYVSANVDTKGERVADQQLGEKLKEVWLMMHERKQLDPMIIETSRYIPEWLLQFVNRCCEADRSDLATQLTVVDQYVSESIGVDHPFMNLPSSIDFLSLMITLKHMKMAFFLLMEGKESSSLSPRTSVSEMTFEIYTKGAPEWDNEVFQGAIRHLVPKDESPLRIKTCVPEPKLQQAVFDIVRNKIDVMLMKRQMSSIEEKISQVQSIEIGEKFKKVEVPNFVKRQSPQVLDSQFDQEVKYALTVFAEVAPEVFEKSVISKDDSEVIFDFQKLQDNCLEASNRINKFGRESIDLITQSWERHIGSLARQLTKNKHEMEVVSTIANFSSFRFQTQAECGIIQHFRSQYLNLNTLRSAVKARDAAALEAEEEIEVDVRKEFKKLTEDLKQQLFLKKNQFNGVKQKVYDDVFKRINAAKGSALQITGEIEPINEEAHKKSDEEHRRTLESIAAKNESMRKEILKMRAIRHLDTIGITRTFEKKLAKAEEERKTANAELWREKYIAEQNQLEMERKLWEAHQRLSATEIEIENMQKELENERMTNIQLVHWKAKNNKQVEELKRQIAQFEEPEGFDVDGLVKQIVDAQEELDTLTIETDAYNEEVSETVEKTMEEIDEMRAHGVKTRVMRSTMLRETTKLTNRSAEMEAAAQQLSEENMLLREENSNLIAKIRAIEAEKASKNAATIAFMEQAAVVRPKTRIRSSSRNKIITKPLVQGNRAVSRI